MCISNQDDDDDDTGACTGWLKIKPYNENSILLTFIFIHVEKCLGSLLHTFL